MEICLDIITYYMCIYSTSCQLQSTMIVIGYICIYYLLVSIEVAPAPELDPMYFYIMRHFTLKRNTNL